MFIADSTGLDFLNSIGTPEDTIVEWLANGADLLAWLQEAKLIDPADAAAIRAKAFPGELDEVAAQARALREWFRDFVLAHMGRPLTAKALDLLGPLNRVLERDEGYGAIVARSAHLHGHKDASGLEWHALRRWSTPNSLILPIAQAMADLVCSENFSLVKGCEGKLCTLYFSTEPTPEPAAGAAWRSAGTAQSRPRSACAQNEEKLAYRGRKISRTLC